MGPKTQNQKQMTSDLEGQATSWQTDLGGDDEERGFRVELLQRLGHVGPVDVGDEPDVWTAG